LNEVLQLNGQHAQPLPRVEVICYCGRLAGRLGHPNQALTLFAAGLHALEVDDFRHVSVSVFNAFDAELLATAYQAAQAALPPEECAAAQAAGQALSLEQAINLAFSAIHLPPRMVNTSRPAELQIFTFGALRVLRKNHELSAEDWVYSKTRELLLYLLHVESASKEQIGAALWPDASEQQLKQNFRMAIYHLRRALGRPEWITFRGGRYAFNRSLDYWHDGAAFGAALAQAASASDNRAAHLQQAVDLYQGDLALESLDTELLLIQREQLRQQALNAMLELGQLQLAAEAFPAAAASYRRAIDLDPYLETAHRGLMGSLAQQGERGAALAHFHALEKLLHRDLHAAPDPATRALADMIKQSDGRDRL
jgi:DNA-binding SARP family transcriptional activator